MSVITAHNLGQSHGAFDVFSGVSFDVPNDARIGIVGPNGIGKTTLLRIVAGVNAPTTGKVSQSRGARLGYLRQEAVEAFAGLDHSIYAEMLTVFAPILVKAESLRAMETRMGEGDMSDELMAEYGTVQEEFEHGGGYEYDVRIAQVLEGLGFPPALWDTALAQLSGGQKTRVLLARLLLERPDLLIMDEPTNHLDGEAVDWLEETLLNWPGALLIVSHDRYFLDRVVDHVWELSRSGMETYRGNYTAYVKQRVERYERAQLIFDRERARLQEEYELVKRYIGWRRYTEAEGKLKLLSRDIVAIEKLGVVGAQGKSYSELGLGRLTPLRVDEAWEHIKAMKPPARPPRVSMKLKAGVRSGSMVMRTKKLVVGYPERTLFSADDIDLQRGDRAALIGPNGAGKTTFLKTVLEHLQPLAGEVRLGVALTIGYFAQAHDSLNPENRVIDEIGEGRDIQLPAARAHLAQYLFRGDDVFKTVKLLSGGERGRLALAKLALDGANLLLLDEPTNHLDIPAQEVLQEALEIFEGTILMVSHDRYLVNRLATQIWDVRDGHLHVFKGVYQEYMADRAEEARRLKEAATTRKRADAQAAAAVQVNAAAMVKPAGKSKDPVSGKSKGSKGKGDVPTLATLESQIAEAEALLATYSVTLEQESASTKVRVDELARLGEAYAATQARIESLMEEWATLSTASVVG